MTKTSGIRAGRAFVELGTNDRELVAGLKRAQARLRAFGASVQRVGLGLGAAGAALAAPLAGSVAAFVRAGDAIDKMSARTGVAAETLSALGFAAEQTGSDIEAVEKGFANLSRTMFDAAQGSAQAVDALAAIGLTVADLQGLSPEEQFNRVADAISALGDASLEGAVAQRIFGRSGRQLLPLLREGADGIAAYVREAEKLGLVISQEQAAAAAKLGDSINRLRRVFKGAAFAAGGALSPAVNLVTDVLVKAATAVSRFISENRGLVLGAAAAAVGLLAAGGALIGVGIGANVAAFALLGLAKAVTLAGVALAFLTSPVALVVAGLLAGGVAFLRFSEAGKKATAAVGASFRQLGQSVGQVLGGIVDAINANELGLAFEILLSGVRVAWLTARNFLIDSMGEFWSTVSNVWAIGAFGITEAFAKAIDFIAGMLLRLKGLVDEDFDIDAALETLAEEGKRESKERAKKLQDALRGPGTSDAEKKQLEDSIRTLGDQLEEARRARDEALSRRDQQRGSLIGGAVESGSRSQGFFGGLPLDRAGFGGDAAKRQLDETKKQTRQIGRVAEAVDRLGNRLAFA